MTIQTFARGSSDTDNPEKANLFEKRGRKTPGLQWKMAELPKGIYLCGWLGLSFSGAENKRCIAVDLTFIEPFFRSS